MNIICTSKINCPEMCHVRDPSKYFMMYPDWLKGDFSFFPRESQYNSFVIFQEFKNNNYKYIELNVNVSVLGYHSS